MSSGPGIPDAANLGDRPFVMSRVATAFLVLTWTAVILRVYVRTVLIRSFGWDDWTIIITLVLYTGLCACIIIITQIETGQELAEAAKFGIYAELPILNRLIKIVVVALSLYTWTSVFLKISLAIFFLRIINKKWHRHVIHVTTGLYTVYGVAFAFIVLFQCGNPRDFLTNEILGKCLRNDIVGPLNYVASTLNAITDLIYVFFPNHIVWNSQMPRPAKISASVLLSFAAVGSIISVVRIAFVSGLKPGSKFFTTSITIAVWSMAEPGIAIFTASLATLRPLFKSLKESSRNIKSSPSSGRTSGSKRKSGSSLSEKARGALKMRQQVQDPEAGIMFDTVKTASEVRVTDVQGPEYDLDEVRFLGERQGSAATVSSPLSREGAPPMPPLMSPLVVMLAGQPTPPLPPLLDDATSQGSHSPSDRVLKHPPPPDVASAKEGKAARKRSPSNPFSDDHDRLRNVGSNKWWRRRPNIIS